MCKVSGLLVALIVATLLAPVLDPATASASARDGSGVLKRTASFTIVNDTGGDIGAVSPNEEPEVSGASCLNTATSSTKSLKITVKGPHAQAGPGFLSGNAGPEDVRWSFAIYQVDPITSALAWVANSSEFSEKADRVTGITFRDQTSAALPLGPTYFIKAEIDWWVGGNEPVGYYIYSPEIFNTIVTTDAGTSDLGSETGGCVSPLAPFASVKTPSGTPGTARSFSLAYFPIKTHIAITWDGSSLGTITTGSNGTASGSFTIPKSPAGQHSLSFTAGSWSATVKITVKPLATVSSRATLRGAKITVYARGFSAGKLVYVYMLKNGAWTSIGSKLTSRTGSADVTVTIPSWASIGTDTIKASTSSTQYAKTTIVINSILVSSASVATQPAAKTPTKTATPTPKATSIPTQAATATLTPTATATPEPTQPPTDAPTEAPTDEPTAPTVDPASPVAGD